MPNGEMSESVLKRPWVSAGQIVRGVYLNTSCGILRKNMRMESKWKAENKKVS
jgi:hypothetical protein